MPASPAGNAWASHLSPALVVATMSPSFSPADVVPTAQQRLDVEQDTALSGPVPSGRESAAQRLPPFVVVMAKPKNGEARPTATQVDVVGQDREART